MHVPFHADWGTDLGNVDLSRYYCVDGKIATILIIGTVTSRWFVDNNGSAVSPVRIGVSPARESDAEAARHILAQSKPARSKSFSFYCILVSLSARSACSRTIVR